MTPLAREVQRVVAGGDTEAAARLLARLQLHQHEGVAPLLVPLFPLLAAHFLDLLRRIEERALTVTASFDPRTAVGTVEYAISNGWTLLVYDRVFEWHHVEGFRPPHSEDAVDLLLYAPGHPFDAVTEYTPPAGVLREVYGF
ncbi:MAG: hypothetical protein ABMA64_31500 [Myxococcota bacterium]